MLSIIDCTTQRENFAYQSQFCWVKSVSSWQQRIIPHCCSQSLVSLLITHAASFPSRVSLYSPFPLCSPPWQSFQSRQRHRYPLQWCPGSPCSARSQVWQKPARMSSRGGAAAGRSLEKWGWSCCGWTHSMQLYAWVSWVTWDEKEMRRSVGRGAAQQWIRGIDVVNWITGNHGKMRCRLTTVLQLWLSFS